VLSQATTFFFNRRSRVRHRLSRRCIRFFVACKLLLAHTRVMNVKVLLLIRLVLLVWRVRRTETVICDCVGRQNRVLVNKVSGLV